MERHNFELICERDMPEAGGTGRLWRHKGCGAELLSICNHDENKCFGVSFYTPPTNSTGVAHILEHSVLCGSQKYPIKEPFAELLKGSLQTFLNAFTFPDKTCYPVASANLQDFYNLIDVYLDAVFHPLITENTFRQEGWHLDAESANAPWTFRGVVYNEMKGVYSSPDSILMERSQQAMFPDNLYSLDSGGNPEHIPDLTYADFRDFHRRYYQPGNARFFFWGDDPEDRRLERVNAEIDGAAPAGPMPEVRLQKRQGDARYIEAPYAAAADETRALVTISWLLAERGNVAEALKMEMLEHILEGMPGSPLRRALMESGLGEDTTGCGLETDLRQMYYSTGLKGIALADAGKVQEVAVSTLRQLAEHGIEKAAVDAAVNSVEFAYRESNTGRFPRGLAAMIMSLSTWLYGGDPMAPLAWEQPLAEIKAALARGDKVFEDIIKRDFLDNPPTRVTLLPDTGLAAAREQAEASRLAEIQARTGPAGRQQIAEETAALREAQLRPDNPEDLARIPALSAKDLPRENSQTPMLVLHEKNSTIIRHDLPANGIVYITLLLPVQRLPARLVPYLPLFARSLTECGSAKRDYADLGMAIAGNTGGLGASPMVGAHVQSRKPFCYLTLAGKAVKDRAPALMDLMREILLTPQANDDILMERLERMLMEAKARLEHGLQAAGHMAVGLRVSARYTGQDALTEMLSGISQLGFIRQLIEKLANAPQDVLADLEAVRLALVSSQDAIFDITADPAEMDAMHNAGNDLLASLPERPALTEGEAITAFSPMDLPAAEVFVTPGQVNYVGKGANLFDFGYKYSGAANVIMRWLRMGRLWEDVRVAGGAYGAFCGLDRISGAMTCASYRDPHVDRTLSAYDGLAAFVRQNPPSGAQLEQAIVGAVGALDTYLLPDAKAARALAHYLSGQTKEMRQQMREEMFAASAADFRAFADALDAFAQSGAICVVGGAKAEERAREHGWAVQKLV